MLLKCYWCGHVSAETELDNGECPHCHKKLDIEYAKYRNEVDWL